MPVTGTVVTSVFLKQGDLKTHKRHPRQGEALCL